MQLNASNKQSKKSCRIDLYAIIYILYSVSRWENKRKGQRGIKECEVNREAWKKRHKHFHHLFYAFSFFVLIFLCRPRVDFMSWVCWVRFFPLIRRPHSCSLIYTFRLHTLPFCLIPVCCVLSSYHPHAHTNSTIFFSCFTLNILLVHLCLYIWSVLVCVFLLIFPFSVQFIFLLLLVSSLLLFSMHPSLFCVGKCIWVRSCSFHSSALLSSRTFIFH